MSGKHQLQQQQDQQQQQVKHQKKSHHKSHKHKNNKHKKEHKQVYNKENMKESEQLPVESNEVENSDVASNEVVSNSSTLPAENKKILTKQSKTILRKLAYKSGINSLSNSCYPIIYHIIDTLLDKIFDAIEKYAQSRSVEKSKKAISTEDLKQVFQAINVDKSKSFDDSSNIFTATVFKRQIQPYLGKSDVKLSGNSIKCMQSFVEQTMLQILKTAANISQNAKRTRVLDRDMELSWQMFNEN